MNEVPVGHATLHGRVLAHRSNYDPIGKRDATDLELCEKLGHVPHFRVASMPDSTPGKEARIVTFLRYGYPVQLAARILLYFQLGNWNKFGHKASLEMLSLALFLQTSRLRAMSTDS
jgi:hypothetical protein